MKKLKLFCIAAAATFAITPAIAQPVHDQAVIPVAVTLNRVLRLNIVSGGNMEFVFNSIADYTNGINNGGANTFYHTTFNVASSTHWDLAIGAENATFIGTDLAANTTPLNNVGYDIVETGTNTVASGAITCAPCAAVVPLVVFPPAADQIASTAAGNAGDIAANAFRIQWRAGTTEGTMNASSILAQDETPDRYVTNVLLDLQDGTL